MWQQLAEIKGALLFPLLFPPLGAGAVHVSMSGDP